MANASNATNNETSTVGRAIVLFGNLEGDDAEIVSALIMYFPILIPGWLAVYCILHCLRKSNYYRKWTLDQSTLEPPDSAFGWLPMVLRMENDQIIEHAGTDSLIFVEFLRMLLRTLSCFSLYALAICVGMNAWCAYASGIDSGPPGLIAKLSIANILTVENIEEVTADRWFALWASVVGIWLLSVLLMYNMRVSWKRVLNWRKIAWRNKKDVSPLCVLIHNLDPRKDSYTQAEVKRMWKRLYGEDVFDVRMVRDSRKLGKLLRAHEKLIAKQEATGCCALKGESLARNTREVEAKRNEIEKEYAAVLNDATGASHFILCKTHRAANAIKQMISIPGQHGLLRTLPAPLPSQVIWTDLYPKLSVWSEPRAIISHVSYFAMLAFWSTPVAVVSTMISVNNLRESISWVPDVLDRLGPDVEAFLVTFLPTVSLTVFNALLPTICFWIAGWGVNVSNGEVQADAFKRLFTFNYVWTFLGVTIASSFVQTLQDIFQSGPTYILRVLGSSLASTSTFWISYLLLQACAVFPLKELARLVDVATELLFGAATTPEPVQWYLVWNKVMLCAAIGLAFGCVQPISLCFTLLYLALMYLLYLRNLIFSYTNQAESQGLFWPTAVSGVTMCLVTAQLLLAGVHMVKLSWLTMSFALLSTPFTILSVHCQHALWAQELSVLSMVECIELDRGYLEPPPRSRPSTSASRRRSSVERIQQKFSNELPEVDLKIVFETDLPQHKPVKLDSEYEQMFAGHYVQPDLLQAKALLEAPSAAHAAVGAASASASASAGVDAYQDVFEDMDYRGGPRPTQPEIGIVQQKISLLAAHSGKSSKLATEAV